MENSQNIEICVVHSDRKIEMLAEEKLETICAQIKKEKEDAEEAKKNKSKE